MNKIYRVVWNKETSTWTAVCEYAKSKGKSSSSSGVVGTLSNGVFTAVRFTYTALVSALILVSGQAWAVTGNGSTTGDSKYCFYDATSQSVVCGDATTSTVDTADNKPAKSVVVGSGSTNIGETGVVIGAKAKIAAGTVTKQTTITTNLTDGVQIGQPKVEYVDSSIANGETTTTDNEKNTKTVVTVEKITNNNPTAAIAIGSEAIATDNQTIAIGQNATASADWDIAIGRRAGHNQKAIDAEGRNIAIGDGALREAINPNNNIALGTDAGQGSTGDFNVVLGTYANSKTVQSSGVNASNVVAIGDRALASSSSSVSIGARTVATGTIATAVGASAEAKGGYSIAQGYAAKAEGVSSIAIGAAQNLPNQTRATANYATAIGFAANAGAEGAIAIGRQVNHDPNGAATKGDTTSKDRNKTTGVDSIAIGTNTNAAAKNAVSVGTNSRATGENSIAQGTQANAGANGAIAIGIRANAESATVVRTTGTNSIAMGIDTHAGANHGVAIGSNASTSTTGQGSVALGASSKAYGVNAAAVGQASEASGQNTFAGGNDSHAIGTSAVAIGDGSGKGTKNIKDGSGDYASGNSSTAVGAYSKSAGEGSTALGVSADAQKYRSVATGAYSVASANSAIAIGDSAQVSEKGLEAVWNTNTKSYDTQEINSTAAIAMGKSAVAKGTGSVAVGHQSKTEFMNSTAVGNETKAVGYNSSAFGFQATAKGVSSVAIGDKALAGIQDDSSHIPSTNRGVAIGTNTNATGETAVALGSNAESKAHRGTALGVLSKAAVNDGVALGAYSIANRDKGEAGADPLSAKQVGSDASVWTATHAAVSVGNDTAITDDPRQGATATPGKFNIPKVTRQITGVAAGSKDTDAVNVAQLKASGFKLTTSESGTGKADGTTEEKVKNGDTVIIDAGDNIKITQAQNKITVATKKDVVFNSVTASTGANQVVLNGDGVKVGDNVLNGDIITVNGANVTNVNSAINQVAAQAFKPLTFTGNTGSSERKLGQTVTISGGLATTSASSNDNVHTVVDSATGTIDIRIANNPVFAGKVTGKGGLDAGGNKVTNVATGTENNDGVNVAQLKQAIKDAQVQSLTKVESNSPFSYISEEGDILKREINPITNALEFYKVGQNGAVTTPYTGNIDNISITTLNPGALQTAQPTTVGNVAPGKKNTDAVNLSQLKGVANALGGGAGLNPDGTFKAPSYSITATDGTQLPPATTVADALKNLNDQVVKPLTFGGDTGTAFERKLGQTTTIKGGITDENKLSNSNIGVVAKDGTLDIKLAKDITIDSVTTGNTTVNNEGVTIIDGPSITKSNGINAGNKVIADVASNLPTTQNNTAIQGSPSNATKAQEAPTNADAIKNNAATVGDVLNAGWNVQTNGDATDFVRAYDTVNFADGVGTTITSETDGNKTTFKVNVNAQSLAESTQLPVVYTNADGKKLYLLEKDDPNAPGNKIKVFNTKPDGKGEDVDPPNVIASMQNATGDTKYPMTLTNVAAGVRANDTVNVSQLGIAGIYNTDADGNLAYTDEKGDTVYHKPDGTYVNAQGDSVIPRGKLILQNKGLNFAGNDGKGNTKLGDTWSIVGGNAGTATTDPRTFTEGTFSGGNIKTSVKDGVVEITMADSPKFGDIVINSPSEGMQGQPDYKAAGRITGVADGVDDKDVATVKQLKEKTATTPLTVTGNKVADLTDADKSKLATAGDIANAINNTGFTLTTAKTADGELGANATNELIKAGDSVTVEADNNIKLTQVNGKISIATKKDVKFDSVTVGEGDNQVVLNNEGIKSGNTTVNNDGITIKAPVNGSTTDVKLTANGLNNGGNKITNVAKGTSDTDAVNVGQLNEQLTATEKTTTAQAGSDKVTVQGTTTGNNTNYVIDLADSTKNSLAKADSALQNIQVNANGTAVTTLDKDNNTLDITQGDNITVSNDGSKVKVALNQDVTGLNSLTSKTITAGEGTNQVILDNTGVNVGGKTYISGTGLNANSKKVTNVADGAITADSKDAVNGGQLHNTAGDIATIIGGNANVDDEGNVTASNIGGTNANTIDDAIKTVKTTVKSTDNSIKVTANTADKTNGTVFDISVNAQGLAESAQLPVVYTKADGTKVYKVGNKFFDNKEGTGTEVPAADIIASMQNADGTTATPTTLANVADGDVNKNSKDAVNGSQLFAQGEGVKNIIGGNTTYDPADGTYKNADIGGTGKATIDEAIKASKTEVAEGKNVTVTTEKGTNGQTIYTVATKDDVSFNKVTAGTGTNQVILDNTGVKVGGNTYISGTGLNANSKKVTNVADGAITADSKDAVNGGQLRNTAGDIATIIGGNANVDDEGNVTASNIGGTGQNNIHDAIQAVHANAAKAKTTVSAGSNIVVTPNTNADGSTDYTVATAKDLTVDSVKAGDTTINNGGVTITNADPAKSVSLTANGLNNGGNKITNVAKGESDTDAVNVSQLNELKKIVTGGNVNTNVTTQQADTGNAPAGTITTVINNPDGSTTTTTETNQTVVVSKDKGGKDYYLTTYNVEGQNTYVTNDVIQAIGKMNEQGIKFFHTNDGEVKPVIQGSNNVDSSASGKYATSVGYQTVADGDNAVAMGNTYVSNKKIEGAKVTEITDGNGEKRYFQVTRATGKNAIALGTGSQALEENTIAIGTGNVVTGKNSGVIGDPSIVTGNNSYSLGNNNTVIAHDAFVVGNEVKQTLDNSVVLGNQSAAVEKHTADKEQGTYYTYAGANDHNVSGVKDIVGVVSVGKDGQTRQIQNVAAGVVSANSTDAINGSQLYYTNEAITNVANNTINMGNQLNNRINDVADDANAGVSSAMAMASLPQAYLPGKSMITGGVASYNGEGAVAVGLSKLSDNGRWVLKISGSADTQGNAGGSIGAGFHF